MRLKTIEDFVKVYGKKIISVVQSCDGSKNLGQIAEETGIPIETLLYVSEKMVLAGLLSVQQY